jgi:hypothetical protein
MTPRERVQRALAHQEADRVPIDLGSSIVTSITKAAYLPLMAHLGLPAGLRRRAGLVATARRRWSRPLLDRPRGQVPGGPAAQNNA